jgi:hypothetical protein
MNMCMCVLHVRVSVRVGGGGEGGTEALSINTTIAHVLIQGLQRTEASTSEIEFRTDLQASEGGSCVAD